MPQEIISKIVTARIRTYSIVFFLCLGFFTGTLTTVIFKLVGRVDDGKIKIVGDVMDVVLCTPTFVFIAYQVVRYYVMG